LAEHGAAVSPDIAPQSFQAFLLALFLFNKECNL
jgi:hypothetical protein